MKMFKGQLMSILVFVIFILMFAELMTFVLLNASYNQISQESSASAAAVNYKLLLSSSASQFAQSSLEKSLAELVKYEYNASLRQGNFVSNFNWYISNIMINGTVPNQPVAALGYNVTLLDMHNSTLRSYNASLKSILGPTALSAQINETNFNIYQADPYTLSVSYMENVVLNSTSGTYRYALPVNATISLNGTYDLWYAQQGILRKIRFASLSNITNVIGNAYASS